MNKPNGAGFYDYEDVPEGISEEMTRGCKNFEEYLRMQYYNDTNGPLSFDRWVQLNLYSEKLILYANAYGEIKKLEGFDLAAN